MGAFRTVRGISVARAWSVQESYEVSDLGEGLFEIRANVSAENLDAVFCDSLAQLAEPLHLIFEAPCNEVKERELGRKPGERFHLDVYYLPDLSRDRAMNLYQGYRELLINDGFIRYGARSHKDGNEVFVGNYKIVHFYGPSTDAFESILRNLGAEKVEQLVTVRDTFTKEEPGEKSRIREDGMNIYDMLEDLIVKEGLFCAKTIED